MSSRSRLDHISAREDPRQAGKVGYRLPEILLAVPCGTMAGAENVVEIERWANRKLAFLRRLLPFGRGVPSHDGLNAVMNALPGSLFAEGFTPWMAAGLVGASYRPGYLISFSHLVFRIDVMFVGLLSLGIVGFVANRVFLMVIHRVFPWYQGEARR